MTRFPLRLIIPAFALFTACGEDSALVKKRDAQKVEIIRLTAELAQMEKHLKNLPEDESAALKTVEISH